jgi:hypothetical protein
MVVYVSSHQAGQLRAVPDLLLLLLGEAFGPGASLFVATRGRDDLAIALCRQSGGLRDSGMMS